MAAVYIKITGGTHIFLHPLQLLKITILLHLRRSDRLKSTDFQTFFLFLLWHKNLKVEPVDQQLEGTELGFMGFMAFIILSHIVS